MTSIQYLFYIAYYIIRVFQGDGNAGRVKGLRQDVYLGSAARSLKPSVENCSTLLVSVDPSPKPARRVPLCMPGRAICVFSSQPSSDGSRCF